MYQFTPKRPGAQRAIAKEKSRARIKENVQLALFSLAFWSVFYLMCLAS